MAGAPRPVAYSFEMVMAGVILLGAMAAGGLAALRRARAGDAAAGGGARLGWQEGRDGLGGDPPTDKSAGAEKGQ